MSKAVIYSMRVSPAAVAAVAPVAGTTGMMKSGNNKNGEPSIKKRSSFLWVLGDMVITNHTSQFSVFLVLILAKLAA